MEPWTLPAERLDARTVRYSPRQAGRTPSRAAFFEALVVDEALRLALTRTLAAHPTAGFFFETPPIDAVLAAQDFAFVLVDSPAVASLRADPAPFRAPLASAPPGPVATFPNLSGDAWLVVPRGLGEPYAHLARFVREGPPAQIDALWAELGRAVLNWRAQRPERLWVSTSGLGVSWLHLRLDTRPKYYSHAPFRSEV